VKLITGHFSNDEALEYDWEKLADKDCTLVFYMAMANLKTLCSQLINAGLDAGTPAAAVENGTTQSQQRIISTLDMLAADVSAQRIKAPAMIIIGNVVSLAQDLDWFQQSLEMTVYDESLSACR
jgi:siroheme synthase